MWLVARPAGGSWADVLVLYVEPYGEQYQGPLPTGSCFRSNEGLSRIACAGISVAAMQNPVPMCGETALTINHNFMAMGY